MLIKSDFWRDLVVPMNDDIAGCFVRDVGGSGLCCLFEELWEKGANVNKKYRMVEAGFERTFIPIVRARQVLEHLHNCGVTLGQLYDAIDAADGMITAGAVRDAIDRYVISQR